MLVPNIINLALSVSLNGNPSKCPDLNEKLNETYQNLRSSGLIYQGIEEELEDHIKNLSKRIRRHLTSMSNRVSEKLNTNSTSSRSRFIPPPIPERPQSHTHEQSQSNAPVTTTA
ncbi:hypothetical protein TpMuguga_04g00189 [Theileria parva strain Muguga]|uniref:Uncharacterized protein n=1 Tax=Theileria parva TaxID=5875 RepID=Q4N303_THEPA|nr:uncharacterized protein TpMuguga_04g00189 [Theileria parva strain Muguga]EAN31541.1 hypothetical protein TpMuguga_04g00189 [Theileria parva strain Muguga]|eukprot:XP_763824.1 hypothetical protein [Theileria parva strain Muguga]